MSSASEFRIALANLRASYRSCTRVAEEANLRSLARVLGAIDDSLLRSAPTAGAQPPESLRLAGELAPLCDAADKVLQAVAALRVKEEDARRLLKRLAGDLAIARAVLHTAPASATVPCGEATTVAYPSEARDTV